MQRETVEAIVRWQSAFGGDEPLEITFHGGEPLVPVESFYHMALPHSHNQTEKNKQL